MGDNKDNTDGALRVLSEVSDLERRLLLRPIETLDLRWDDGFRWTPRAVGVPPHEIRVEPVIESFRPTDAAWSGRGFRIEVVELGIAKYATLIALRVHASGHPWPDQFDLVDPLCRRKSALYLNDSVTGRYYFPVGENGLGEASKAEPATAVIAFEPFAAATSSVTLCLSSWSSATFETMALTLNPDGLAEAIRQQLRSEWLAARLRRRMLQATHRITRPANTTPTPAGLRSIGQWWP